MALPQHNWEWKLAFFSEKYGIFFPTVCLIFVAFFLYKSRARQGILSSILIPGLGFNALKIGELCAKKEKYEEDFVCS